MSDSSSGVFFDDLIDESGSWMIMLNEEDENNIDVLYTILGVTGFFICIYSLRFWCDKKKL